MEGIKIPAPKVKIAKGKSMKLLLMARQNAKNYFEQFFATQNKEEEMLGLSLKNLQKLGRLSSPPERIEAFDISNIQGKYAVGSMIVFLKGKPAKDQYRKFRIRTKDTPDDYAMMAEVLRRRLGNAWPMPDLWIIDGGKGQLGAALKVLRDTKNKIPVMALAKNRKRSAAKSAEAKPSSFGKNKEDSPLPSSISDMYEGRRRREEIYFPGRMKSVKLTEGEPTTFLIQRIRDEAHRFAITYHRNVRSRALFE